MKETGRIMEAQINNRIGMVCGTFVALQMPAFLVRIISFIVVTSQEMDGTLPKN